MWAMIPNELHNAGQIHLRGLPATSRPRNHKDNDLGSLDEADVGAGDAALGCIGHMANPRMVLGQASAERFKGIQTRRVVDRWDNGS